MIEVELELLGDESVLAYYRQAPKKIQQNLRGALQRSARLLKSEMEREVPVVSGRLQKSIVARRVGPLFWTVGPTEEYGAVVNAGREPGQKAPPLSSPRFQAWLSSHGIPRRQWWAVARAIGRDGTKPTHFMDNAFDRSYDAMVDIIQQAMDRALGL